MMYGLVLETGRRWGEVATTHQITDVEAVFSPEKPHRHFLTRPRGGSKTTDLAGLALSWLAMEAAPMANGHVVASSVDQAAILIDAAAGIVARTPELQDIITVESTRLLAPNGAWVRVLSQSDSGSWGLRDAHLLILDEFAQWPETRGSKRVYTAIRSTVQKVPGCRLVILTSAGEPSHWSYLEVYKKAAQDPTWRISAMPGPVPWQDPEELESLRRELRPSEYDRLVLNIWSEDEGHAISPEDWELAAQPAFPWGTGYSINHPGPHKYIITVDVGILNDATAICVAHREPIDPTGPARSPQRLVVDHIERWKGSKKRPIQVAAIEAWLVTASKYWNHARVYADPNQFRGSIQNLLRQGVRGEAWNFTSSSVGLIATALVQAFRNQQIMVPDIPVLEEELLRVRLRESSVGSVRLDHEKGAHDDQAVVIGMAAHILLGGNQHGPTSGYVEYLKNRTELAKRESDLGAEDKRNITTHLKRIKEADPQKAFRCQQITCKHRWRGDMCVFCGISSTLDPRSANESTESNESL